MAKAPQAPQEDKARLLRAAAFHIHRKRPAVEVLDEILGQESRGGKARQWRETFTALQERGFTAALETAGFISSETALLLDLIVEDGDHRQIAAALTRLADAAG